MRADTCEQNSNYLDSLVQMGVLKMMRQDGEEWVVFQRPLSDLLDQAQKKGFLQPADDDIAPLTAISFAIGMTVLEERGSMFSQEDLLGVAAVMKGMISCAFRNGLTRSDMLAERVASPATRGPL
jgi:hypothetical protein